MNLKWAAHGANKSAEAIHPHGGQSILTSGASVESARGAVILVHGRGATASSILTLAAELPHPELAYVAPQAAGGSWYPLSFMAERERNEPELSSALLRLDETVSLLETAGVASERIMLLGFSQGACLALEYALRRSMGGRQVSSERFTDSKSVDPGAADPSQARRGPRLGPRLGAVVALTGGLIGPPEARWNDLGWRATLAGAPIFIGTSDVDPHVPLTRAEESAAVLETLGADVELKVYPGFGHSVNADELAHARRLLERMMSWRNGRSEEGE